MDKRQFDTGYNPYGPEQTAARQVLARLRISLTAVCILVVSTYAVAFSAAVTFNLILSSGIIGLRYMHIAEEICNMLVYVAQLTFPALVFLIMRPGKFSDCIFIQSDEKKEKMSVGSVLRYAALTFALSCVMSVISSVISTAMGLDSSVFEYPVPQNGFDFLLDIVSVAILPAIFEELFFRGLLLREFLPYGKSFAIVTSAFFFATAHGSAQQMVYSFVYGLFFAFIALKTGSLFTGMIIHFLNNAYSCVLDYLSTKMAEQSFDFLAGVLQVFLIAAGLLVAVYLIGKDKIAVNDASDNTGYPGKPGIGDCFAAYLSPVMIVYYVFAAIETLVSYFPV